MCKNACKMEAQSHKIRKNTCKMHGCRAESHYQHALSQALTLGFRVFLFLQEHKGWRPQWKSIILNCISKTGKCTEVRGGVPTPHASPLSMQRLKIQSLLVCSLVMGGDAPSMGGGELGGI